jgi:hypothetical protein
LRRPVSEATGFADRRVNFINNERREFLFATPAEVGVLLLEKFRGALDFTEDIAALEYFQSCRRCPQSAFTSGEVRG